MTMYTNSFEQNQKKSFPEEYESQFLPREAPQPQPEPSAQPEQAALPVSSRQGKSDGILSKAMDIFRGLEIDDLLLIAVGILLLLDSDEDNDVIVIFIAIMLFF